jgi:hypothetical protein
MAGFNYLSVTTNLRAANETFMAGKSIKRTGRYVMGSRQPYAVRIWAWGMQLLWWAILKIKPNVGDELVLIGEKQKPDKGIAIH